MSLCSRPTTELDCDCLPRKQYRYEEGPPPPPRAVEDEAASSSGLGWALLVPASLWTHPSDRSPQWVSPVSLPLICPHGHSASCLHRPLTPPDLSTSSSAPQEQGGIPRAVPPLKAPHHPPPDSSSSAVYFLPIACNFCMF